MLYISVLKNEVFPIIWWLEFVHKLLYVKNIEPYHPASFYSFMVLAVAWGTHS